MQVIYDYIVTVTIFFLIFSFSTASLFNIVETPMQHFSEQELSTRAETVLGNIIGYVGDPEGWASNITLQPGQLRAVGLSKMPKSDVIYDLDMDALARLMNVDTGASISQSILYNLLNLGRDYRFYLSLTPVLNITVAPTRYVTSPPAPSGQQYACSFIVTVRTHELTPVGNVNLTVYILTVYWDNNAKSLTYATNETKYALTSWNGSANFNYTSFMTNLLQQQQGEIHLVGSLLVVVGNFYGMQTMTVYQASHTKMPILTGIEIGKYIIFQDPGGIKVPQGKEHPMDSAECIFNGVIVTQVVPSNIGSSCPWLLSHNGKNYRVYELTYIEPDIYWTTFVIKYTGDYGLVVFPRIPANFKVGDVIPRGTQVVGIRRIVFIEKMAFFADFYFWRTNS